MNKDDHISDLDNSMGESDDVWTSGCELSDEEEEDNPHFRGPLS